MRWHASPASTRFDGQIAAVPVTLLSREEDVHHPLNHRPQHQAAATRRTFPSKPVIRTTAPPAKLPDHRRPTIASPSETIRLSATVVISPRPQQPVSGSLLTPRTDDPPVSDAHTKFLVCAGHAMSTESPRNNNDEESSTAVAIPCTITPRMTTALMTSTETPRSQCGLQRSNSELELIIHELREKIALRERSLSPEQNDDDTPERGSHHSRKHLKNPVEKMSLASSSSASSGIQLRRQASASQVQATRLVREGSAAMVTPLVLSSSASRAALAHGGSVAHHHNHAGSSGNAETKEPSPAQLEQLEPAEGFRIRAYVTGSDARVPVNPVFTSSVSLGQNQPVSLASPPRVLSPVHPTESAKPVHASLLRPSKPRVRTLVDLDLELDRLHGVDGDGTGGGGDLSPVGPWVLDHDASTSLASARSASSLSTNASLSELVPPTCDSGELSPRSRLLWLSDCCSDDAWATTSGRVMAMLRPGCTQRNRPASAVELRRRSIKTKSTGTPGKTRATSAKPLPRRPSTDSSSGQDQAAKPMGSKALPRVAQRPRSGNGSSGSSSVNSSSSSGARVLIAQRASFRA